MFSCCARHEFDDGSEILAGEDAHGLCLILDGPASLEVSIQFDQVLAKPHEYVFYSTERGKIATLERADMGEVDAWLATTALALEVH